MSPQLLTLKKEKVITVIMDIYHEYHLSTLIKESCDNKCGSGRVEKLQHSYIASGNVQWRNHCYNSFPVPQKVKHSYMNQKFYSQMYTLNNLKHMPT